MLEADSTDLRVIATMSGPWLDIGCGPGRMVRAAMDRGIDAMGIDVSATAVAMANRAGLNVIHGSVFDPLPSEGLWQAGRPARRRQHWYRRRRGCDASPLP